MPVNLLLSLAGAALLVLVFPRFDLALLAPVALTPLLLAAAREASPWRRFRNGWVAGVLYWAGTCYWIQFVLEFHGGMPVALSWVGFAVFCVAKALHLALFAWLAGPLLRLRWAVLAAPALWVVGERTHAWLGFTWLALGNAGIGMEIPMRLAPWTGVWGLSFVFACMATALALALLRRPRIELAPAAPLAIMLLLPRLPEAQPGTELAVLVQPSISQTAEWTPQWVAQQKRLLITLSMKEALKTPGVSPALIVWPEAPAPLYYQDDPELKREVDTLARVTGANVILNTVPRRQDGMPLNSALMVNAKGAAGRYDKMRLVPFGEFVPWPFGAFLKKITNEAGDFAPGAAQTLLPAGRHRVGAFVCYESVFAGFVRRFSMQGAELFVNISNDGWYGDSAARNQHLLIARMRAAENRRWLLRATNDGITATIDPAGRVWRHLPSFQAGAARTGFRWIGETTFYSLFGDWFVWLCAAGAGLGLAWEARFRKPAPPGVAVSTPLPG